MGQDIAVDLATCYGMDGLGLKPPRGGRFSAPLHNSSVGHPVFYTVGTGTFPGEKNPERGVEHTLPSGTELEERMKLYLHSQPLPSRHIVGLCYF